VFIIYPSDIKMLGYIIVNIQAVVLIMKNVAVLIIA